MELIHIIIGAQLIMFFVLCFFVGYLLGQRKADNGKYQIIVDKPGITPTATPQATPQPIVEKKIPQSIVSKFPDPTFVRQQKDKEQVEAYFKDAKENKRLSGSFVR